MRETVTSSNSTIPRWLTQETAAQYLSISVRQLQVLQKAGRIQASYFLGPRSPRYDRFALDGILSNGKQTETPTEGSSVRLAAG
jgi:hypothetical protein